MIRHDAVFEEAEVVDDKPQRNEKGQFLKGNKCGRKNPVLQNLREATKQEVLQCAYSLCKPWATLEEDLKDPRASRLELLTADAIHTKEYKFIAWLLEMAIGKPKQVNEIETNLVPTIIERINGSTVELGFEEVDSKDV